MAKIIFVVEELAPHPHPIAQVTTQIVQTLAEQQHDILVLTTYKPGREIPKLHSRVEVIQPFTRWSVLELPRLLQVIYRFSPDIIHLIQPFAKPLGSWFSATNLLPAVAEQFGHLLKVLSLFEIPESGLRKTPLEWVTQQSDLITVLNRLQRQVVSSLPGFSERQTVEILPLSFSATSTAFSQRQSDISKLLFVPGALSDHHDHSELLQIFSTALKDRDDWGLLFPRINWQQNIPGRKKLWQELQSLDLDKKIIVPGDENAGNPFTLYKGDIVVWAATLGLSSLLANWFLNQSAAHRLPTVLSSVQAEFSAQEWLTSANCWITGTDPLDLTQSLKKVLDEFPRAAETESMDMSTASGDRTGNWLSRIYQHHLAKTNR